MIAAPVAGIRIGYLQTQILCCAYAIKRNDIVISAGTQRFVRNTGICDEQNEPVEFPRVLSDFPNIRHC